IYFKKLRDKEKELSTLFEKYRKVSDLKEKRKIKSLIFEIENEIDCIKNKIVVSNLRLVVSVAKRFQNKYISLIDLINEGNLALIKAARKFDPDKDVKFSTYAKWWIRSALWQVLTQKYPYSLKGRDLTNLFFMEKMIEKLKAELGRMPTFEEIKAEFNKEYPLKKSKISLQELRNLYDISKDSFSLSMNLKEEEDIKFEDLIKSKNIQDPETELIRQSLRQELGTLLEKLSEIERKIIILRFGLGKEKKPLSINEVSKRIGLSRERIRQIEKKAIYKLRKFSQYYRLESFLN
ncbi:MAG: sigma-70 family RNA polymerase sigma factor, partial [Thermoanaerobaculia bacterium]